MITWMETLDLAAVSALWSGDLTWKSLGGTHFASLEQCPDSRLHKESGKSRPTHVQPFPASGHVHATELESSPRESALMKGLDAVMKVFFFCESCPWQVASVVGFVFCESLIPLHACLTLQLRRPTFESLQIPYASANCL